MPYPIEQIEEMLRKYNSQNPYADESEQFDLIEFAPQIVEQLLNDLKRLSKEQKIWSELAQKYFIYCKSAESPTLTPRQMDYELGAEAARLMQEKGKEG